METSVIVGWVLSLLGAAALFAGGVLDILRNPGMVKNMEEIGFPLETLRPFGFIKAIIAVLSLVPATAFVGVILATGWMGGAIAAHVRVRKNYAVQVILPIVYWIGFGLRHQSTMRMLLGV